MAQIKIVVFQDMRRKHPQLARGATALPLKARGRQARFARSNIGDHRAARFNLIRDFVEKGSARSAGCGAIIPKCSFSGLNGLIHQSGAAL